MSSKASPGSTGAHLYFEDLKIRTKTGLGKRKTIVEATSGHFKPGRVTAIMGPSGAGKTTLLEALCQRSKRLKVTGRIFCTASPVSAKQPPNLLNLSKATAFVEQHDVFFPYMTPKEVLNFAAGLRNAAKAIPGLVEALQLSSCLDTYIGGALDQGVSGGEKKRISIAVALLNDPSILVLDEPTTGLDLAMAELLVRLLYRYSRKHRKTIVMTIHQPSSFVYHQCDRLMLLAHGFTLYFGHSAKALRHFGLLGFHCPDDTNPSEYFIELLGEMEKEEVRRLNEVSSQQQMDEFRGSKARKISELQEESVEERNEMQSYMKQFAMIF